MMKRFKTFLGYTILVSLSLAFTVMSCYVLYTSSTIFVVSLIMSVVAVALWALGMYLVE